VSIGGPGNDNFIFHPGVGADTIVNFNAQADTIELDHFANVQSTQQLTSLITADAHGDAVIELGHNDSITIPGTTASYLQAHLQSLVHLH
jgi:Ca2+-binding RTX toxin-like protein